MIVLSIKPWQLPLVGVFFFMAKRFIDTDLFKDEWFAELSKDGKLFFLYYITNCDHAGLLKFSKRHVIFCTEIESPETAIKELGKRLVTVTEHLLWMPNFFKFQYPNWPEKRFRAADAAYEMLKKLPLDLNTYLSLTKEFTNSYGIGNGNGKGSNVLKAIEKW